MTRRIIIFFVDFINICYNALMNWKDKKGKQVTRWFNYKGTHKSICFVCGNPFKSFISDKRKYCSWRCYQQSPTRGTRPRNRRKEVCGWCQKEFERPVANFKAKKRHFCSHSCSADWWAEYSPHGKNHPSWSGGYTQKAYTDGWARIKKEVKKRADNKCESCGFIHKLMDVHHKIPVRLKKHIKITNHLKNLQLLCRPCHVKADCLLRQKA